MAKRKRKHIPREQLLASALASLLPQDMRDVLRARKASAKEVIRLFTPDHIALHCFGGSDRWWNLDMRLRGVELKTKDRADTSRAAKAIRIDTKWQSFTRSLYNKKKPRPPNRYRWPKRAFPSAQK